MLKNKSRVHTDPPPATPVYVGAGGARFSQFEKVAAAYGGGMPRREQGIPDGDGVTDAAKQQNAATGTKPE